VGCDATWTCMWGTNVLEQLTASALKMEAVCSSETLVPTYKSTWHHNPENHNQHIHRLDNLSFVLLFISFYITLKVDLKIRI
jgi:hypothetical protein